MKKLKFKTTTIKSGKEDFKKLWSNVEFKPPDEGCYDGKKIDRYIGDEFILWDTGQEIKLPPLSQFIKKIKNTKSDPL